jgi:hypothetical protein
MLSPTSGVIEKLTAADSIDFVARRDDFGGTGGFACHRRLQAGAWSVHLQSRARQQAVFGCGSGCSVLQHLDFFSACDEFLVGQVGNLRAGCQPALS